MQPFDGVAGNAEVPCVETVALYSDIAVAVVKRREVQWVADYLPPMLPARELTVVIVVVATADVRTY